METDNEAAGQQYNPPEINFTSATSYDGQDSHIDPFSSQGPASASGPNWTEQGLQEVSPEESSGNVALEFTDSHVTPYTVVEGKIGSSSILTVGVHPEDQGGSLMPQGTVYSSDGPHFSGGRSSSVPHGDQPAPHGKAWFWNPRRYQTYFNVDTSDVLKRMADSLKGPFMPNFLDNTRTNPDLYGPFWVVTTVIFITAVTGNLNDYLSHSKNQRAAEGDDVDFWFYDIDKVRIRCRTEVGCCVWRWYVCAALHADFLRRSPSAHSYSTATLDWLGCFFGEFWRTTSLLSAWRTCGVSMATH